METNSGRYDDIINMDRPVSRHHVPMPLENRAAQFAPFAALTGYDDAVDEAARLTDRRIELSEEMKAELDLKLAGIAAHIEEKPEITVTYFVQDTLKDGGSYKTYTGRVRRIDLTEREIVFEDRSVVALDDILDVRQ